MKTIVSIWPMQESAYRAMHIPKGPGDTNAFILQPGSIDAPTLLRINEFDNKIYMGKNVYQTITIPAYQIADDLVNQWRNHKNMPEDSGLPGIWVCSIDNPTVEQVKALPETLEWNASQMTLASSKVREARMFAARNTPQDWRNITKLHLFMGKLLNIQGEPWQDYDSKNAIGKVRCPFCESPMVADAAICGTCREIVNISKYNELRAGQGLAPKQVAAPAPPKPS